MERTDGLPPAPMPHGALALPLPDYDTIPLPSLTHRIRMLEAAEVAVMLQYELEHADRSTVVAALRYRLERLQRGQSASPGPVTALPPA